MFEKNDPAHTGFAEALLYIDALRNIQASLAGTPSRAFGVDIPETANVAKLEEVANIAKDKLRLWSKELAQEDVDTLYTQYDGETLKQVGLNFAPPETRPVRSRFVCTFFAEASTMDLATGAEKLIEDREILKRLAGVKTRSGIDDISDLPAFDEDDWLLRAFVRLAYRPDLSFRGKPGRLVCELHLESAVRGNTAMVEVLRSTGEALWNSVWGWTVEWQTPQLDVLAADEGIAVFVDGTVRGIKVEYEGAN